MRNIDVSMMEWFKWLCFGLPPVCVCASVRPLCAVCVHLSFPCVCMCANVQ